MPPTRPVSSGVQFKVDGSNVGSEDAAAPYALRWDTTAVPNGRHLLTRGGPQCRGPRDHEHGDQRHRQQRDRTAPTVSVSSPRAERRFPAPFR
jgi:hypothetical protein